MKQPPRFNPRVQTPLSSAQTPCTFVSQGIEDASHLPLLHIADATAERIVKAGFKTVGLLGTRFTMRKDFCRSRLSEKFGLTVVVPDEKAREAVHDVIYTELCNGVVRAESREVHYTFIANLKTGEKGGVFDFGVHGDRTVG